jgi:acyl-coenzyme A thioesterase 13
MNEKVVKLNKYLISFTSKLGFGKDLFNSDLLSVVSELKSNDNSKTIMLKDYEYGFKYKVHQGTLNYWGAMHGGSIATLIDISSTIAITASDRTNRKNISIELGTSYLNPIYSNKIIYINCKVPKIGKTIAYSTIEVLDSDNLTVLATGTHTKAMLTDIWELDKNI